MRLPDWLLLWIWQALIGEIYPEIRAIAVRFDTGKNLLLRYYFDRVPTEDDIEGIECVITNIFAQTSSNDQIKNITKEAIFTEQRMADLDALDGFVYARREYDL